MSPYQIYHGLNPRTILEANLGVDDRIYSETADEYIKQIKNRIKILRESQKLINECNADAKKAKYDRKATCFDFKVGQLVMMRNTVIKLGSSSKLTCKYIGPYRIARLIGITNAIFQM